MTNRTFNEYLKEIKKYLKHEPSNEDILHEQEEHISTPMVDDYRKMLAIKCWLHGELYLKTFIECVQDGKDPNNILEENHF